MGTEVVRKQQVVVGAGDVVKLSKYKQTDFPSFDKVQKDEAKSASPVK